MIRVMIRHSARRWIVLLALAGSALTASPTTAQTSVPMEFPPPGSRRITRGLDQAGGSHLTTYTVLEPGSFQGRPGFRVSDDIGVQFFERASRNWFGTVVREKERSGATPHHGSLAWPLEVGKSWSSVYQHRDNLRNFLWKVDDRASFALMREFYDQLAKVDAGQALQAAQRAAMKEFPHPFAWAAFGLTGVGR
jgi:hypothetical protein